MKMCENRGNNGALWCLWLVSNDAAQKDKGTWKRSDPHIIDGMYKYVSVPLVASVLFDPFSFSY